MLFSVNAIISVKNILKNYMTTEKELTYKKIFIFWAPLSFMWVAMALEKPIINSVIARMPFATENLAIFGVVFALSLIIEGPIIQMLSAANALSTSYDNYKRLSRFLLFIILILTAIHILICVPQVFNFIAKKLLNLNDDFITPARITLIIMIPWAPAIGYRRMWQGVLIRAGRTYSATIIMIIRIIATIIALFIGYFFTDIRGSYIAAASLSVGVITGAIIAAIFASKTIQEKKIQSDNTPVISWKDLFVFYMPLALTSFVTMSSRPIISAGITRGLLPIESLAAWPVTYSFVFLFLSFPYSFQEAAIALFSGKKNNRMLLNSIIAIGAITVFVYAAAVLSPFGRVFFLSKISGLPEYLISISITPLIIMIIVSSVVPVITWLRAVNIHEKTTSTIAIAVFINLTVVVLTMTLLNMFFSIVGITAAAISFAAAVSAEAVFLIIATKRNAAGKLRSAQQRLHNSSTSATNSQD